MKCIILAAGYATRLKPLTDNTPKHLLPVGGRPLLEYTLESLAPHVDSFVIVTNNKFYGVFREWAQQLPLEVPLQVINDGTSSNEDRLGSIGDMKFALGGTYDDDVTVVCGDNLAEFDMQRLFDFFDAHRSTAIAAYDVKEMEQAKKLGIIAIDHRNIVTNFVEKPQLPPSTLASTGFYIFPQHAIARIDEYLTAGGDKDKSGSFIEWLYKREPVRAFVFSEGWWDIGTHDQYQEVNRIYERKRTT